MMEFVDRMSYYVKNAPKDRHVTYVIYGEGKSETQEIAGKR